MSKKLWQAIGKWSDCPLPGPTPPQPTPTNIPPSTPSKRTEKQWDESHFFPADEESPRAARKQHDLSIDIQSCESEKISSPGNTRNNLLNPSKIFAQRGLQNKVKVTAQQAKLLKTDLNALRNEVMKERELLSKELLAALNNFYNKFSKPTEGRIEMISCQRCDHSKSLIDQLTRQCWELQARLKEARESREEKVGKKVAQEETPMKKIENSLLQERGEAVRRLKAQVEQLKRENQALMQQMEASEERVLQLQEQYKQSLLTFKSEIEVINETCCRKIKSIIEEKAYSDSQLRILHEKYLSLQHAQDEEQLRRTAQKRHLTYFPQKDTTPYISTISELNSFVKQPIKSEMAATRKITPRNTTSLSSLQLTHWDSLTLPQAVPSVGRNYFESTPQSRKSKNTSQPSFEIALERLEEIKQDVRKQINRSKKMSK